MMIQLLQQMELLPEMVQPDDKDIMEYPEAMRVFIGQLLKLN